MPYNSESVTDYSASSIADACTWIQSQIPNDEKNDVTKVITWEGRKVVVFLSAKISYGNLPEEVVQYLDTKTKKTLAHPKTPVIECLTANSETLKLAEEIAASLYGKDKFYTGAHIKPSVANPMIGIIAVGLT